MQAPAYNTVAWFQVGTDNPDKARQFYGRLFGWTFRADPMGGGFYDLITCPGQDEPTGGILNTGGEGPNHAVFFVIVQDVAAVCAETEKAGGKVLEPPRTAPGGLVTAHLLDPAGNAFGVFTPPAA
jgi:uncharacterized protein